MALQSRIRGRLVVRVLAWVVVAVWLQMWLPDPYVVIKVTPSVPKGLYYFRAPTHLTWGTRVVLPVPNDMQALVYGHGWFPVGAPLHMPMAARIGDTGCVDADGRLVARAVATAMP